MITVTEKAQERITNLLSKQEGDLFLRVAVIGGGCSGFQMDLGYDSIREDDEQYGNVIVDSLSYRYIEGLTIDFVESIQGSGFKFDNPSSKRTCGCGKSFAT